MWGEFGAHSCLYPHYMGDLPEGRTDSEYVSKHLLLHLLQHNVTPSILSEINARELNNSNPTQLTTKESIKTWIETSVPIGYKEAYFIVASHCCLAEVLAPIKAELAREPHLHLTSLVNTVVVSTGICEAIYHFTEKCDKLWLSIVNGVSTTHAERLQVLFDTLMELQSQSLEIVYRTPGYAAFDNTLVPIDAMAEYTRQYAAQVYAHSRFVETADGALKCMYKGDAYTVALTTETDNTKNFAWHTLQAKPDLCRLVRGSPPSVILAAHTRRHSTSLWI
jgi:hypothetical protein